MCQHASGSRAAIGASAHRATARHRATTRANNFRFIAHHHLLRLGVRQALYLDHDTWVAVRQLTPLFEHHAPRGTAIVAARRPVGWGGDWELNLSHPAARARGMVNVSRLFNAGGERSESNPSPIGRR